MDLATEGVGLRDGTVVALEGVTLRLPAGTHALVLGPARAGKTPLLKILAGLLRPTSGTVRWDAADPFGLPAEALRTEQARLGMVFQTDALFDSMTVLQNVALPLTNRGVAPDEARERARATLRDVGLEAAADKLPEVLSGGMRKRAGIARAVVARPEVLLADDPLAGLDPHTAQQVAGVLRRAAEGRTLIVAMPDPVPALELPRRIVLNGGTVRSA